MRFSRLVAILAVPCQIAAAQNALKPVTGPLTLDDAIRIARDNNPQYRETANTLRSSDAQVRSTYGALLPNVSAAFGSTYTQGGTQVFSGISQQSLSSYNAFYQLSLNYNISSGALFAPKAVNASRNATIATINGASELVRETVTLDYIQALEAEAQAALQDTLVQSAQTQVDLANAKMKVGAGTILDVQNFQVQLGQAQVTALQAHNAAKVAKLALTQAMGVAPSPDVQLTTTFAVAKPTFSLDSVLDLARHVNPALNSARATNYATDMQVKIARMAYTPTLGLSTGFGAQAYQYADASVIPNQLAASAASQRTSCFYQDSVRAGAGMPPLSNSSGPVNCSTLGLTTITPNRGSLPWGPFSNRPLSVSASLSIPVFNGFAREQQIEVAKVNADNAAYEVKNQELQLNTNVSQAYLNLMTAAQTIDMQIQNAAYAKAALDGAEQRYRAGAASYVDVVTAHATDQQAEVARVNAIYDYHKAFATLENAVGRPLR